MANAFFFSSKPISEEDLLTRRRSTISDLVALFSRREVLVRGNSSSPEEQENSRENDAEMILDPILFPLRISITKCLFCLGDDHLSYEDRIRLFSRTDALRRHVDKVHLFPFSIHKCCPHPACDILFENEIQFKNRAAIVHAFRLSIRQSTAFSTSVANGKDAQYQELAPTQSRRLKRSPKIISMRAN